MPTNLAKLVGQQDRKSFMAVTKELQNNASGPNEAISKGGCEDEVEVLEESSVLDMRLEWPREFRKRKFLKAADATK